MMTNFISYLFSTMVIFDSIYFIVCCVPVFYDLYLNGWYCMDIDRLQLIVLPCCVFFYLAFYIFVSFYALLVFLITILVFFFLKWLLYLVLQCTKSAVDLRVPLEKKALNAHCLKIYVKCLNADIFWPFGMRKLWR